MTTAISRKRVLIDDSTCVNCIDEPQCKSARLHDADLESPQPASNLDEFSEASRDRPRRSLKRTNTSQNYRRAKRRRRHRPHKDTITCTTNDIQLDDENSAGLSDPKTQGDVQKTSEMPLENGDSAIPDAAIKPEPCSICLEKVSDCEGGQYGLLENCQHVFCYSCIEKWRTGTDYNTEFLRKCPVCKRASWYNVPSSIAITGYNRDRYIIQFLIEHKERNVFYPFILWDREYKST